MQPGVRIIRGPDWNSKRQDGGEGHVGTVIYVPKDGPADGHVSVIWDNGRAYRYRAGQDGKYDLRIVDNTPAGVVQEGITCDVCKMDPIRGIRWKCGVCKDFDLCTPCYMTGIHDTGHSFMRIEHQHKHASPVSPRNGTPTIEIQGVFKGAVVMRGSSWKWKNDDGGNSGSGDVTDVVPWKPDLPRSAVKVAWRQTKKEGIYRLGAEGCVDVVYETCASGGKVYQDHLPLVDVVNPDQIKLRASDKVKVTLDLESFKRLQEHDNYGGWNDKMSQCLSEVGTIVRMLYEGKSVRVQYEDGQAFTMNRQALYRIHSFSVGEAVRILPDVNTVRDLQAGHGGWNDDMLGSLGQVGRVAKIDADGDMRVKVGDRKWIFSPVCVQPLDDPKQSDSVPGLKPDEMEQDKVDDFRRMQRDMDRLAGVLADLFVGLMRALPDSDDDSELSLLDAASKGDIEKVKAIVGKDSSKVNVSPGQKNALQLACYNGHIPVVQYLLDQNVDVLAVDDEGDTALHYASYGKEASAMKLLLKKGAQPDKQNNKGLTALHITVGKGNVQGTKLLIKNKASVNLKDKDGDTPMHDCITQIKRQGLLVPAVLKAPGADFTIMNGTNFNVLHWAALKNVTEAATIVLTLKPSIVNDKMTEGFAALHICAANDHVEIASELIQAKADINIRNPEGLTPLHIAVSQSHKRTVQLLINAGGNVNMQDNLGNTPLHVAHSKVLSHEDASLLGVSMGNDETGIQISCMLIEAKGSLEVKNNQGKTPLDLCSDFTTREFLKRLASQSFKNSMQTSVKGVVLPPHWEHMERTDKLKMIQLDGQGAGSLLEREYQEVQTKFMKTMPQARVSGIQRVQNKFLWEHYFFKRTQMEAEYGAGCTNELDLYHGTKPELVDIICEDNLDPRLAGDRVGVLFGQGTYFASEAKYSDGYSEPDSKRNKFIFQCRVLAGKWTYGDPKYRRPPAIENHPKKNKLYDCCVDNVRNPKIFCLFDINQYYPEYVIKYQ